ncbi:AAA family ATPase [Candidatus Bathyarchaeota archaeon]|nr:AAA family ATPase [Candidatus Bathyarchaeota archaeon]
MVGGRVLPSSEALEGIFERYLSGSRIFSNREVLRHDYVPKNLPHRQHEIDRLGRILAPALGLSKVSNVFIYGKTGTGKTAVVKHVLESLGRKASELGARLRLSYVNCRLAGTNYRVLAEICRSIDVQVPFTGLAVGEIFDRFRLGVNKSRSCLIVVLDEIDTLVKRREENSLLYELTRVNESLRGNWVGLVGVSNDLRFKEYLEPRILSCLSEEEVVFRPYLADELYNILQDRARIAFNEGRLKDSALRLCAALAAGEHGDARRALDLLRVAGEVAERNGSEEVTEEHVRIAQRKVEHDRIGEVLESLPLHLKLVLLSVFLFSNYSREDAVTGEIYTIYQELCEEVKIDPLTQRRVSGLISEMDMMGLLNARIVNFGRYGRTKKVRLGISGRSIVEILSDDGLVRPLFHYVPKSIRGSKRAP